MRVSEIMSNRPVTVSPRATISEAISRMLAGHISGLPVVDDEGHLVGIISEADFLRRSEIGTQKRPSRWLEWLIEPGRRADDYVRANGRVAREVMTENVVSVSADATLLEAVNIMEEHKVKRLPVVRSGKLVGMLTRADLIRALSGYVAPIYTDTITTDAEIKNSVVLEMRAQTWSPVASVDVEVRDGIVTLRGVITDERERNALKVIAENADGVKGVKDELALIEP